MKENQLGLNAWQLRTAVTIIVFVVAALASRLVGAILLSFSAGLLLWPCTVEWARLSAPLIRSMVQRVRRWCQDMAGVAIPRVPGETRSVWTQTIDVLSPEAPESTEFAAVSPIVVPLAPTDAAKGALLGTGASPNRRRRQKKAGRAVVCQVAKGTVAPGCMPDDDAANVDDTAADGAFGYGAAVRLGAEVPDGDAANADAIDTSTAADAAFGHEAAARLGAETCSPVCSEDEKPAWVAGNASEDERAPTLAAEVPDGDAANADAINTSTAADGAFGYGAAARLGVETCSLICNGDEKPARVAGNASENECAPTLEPWDPLGSFADTRGMQHARLLLLLSGEAANTKLYKNNLAAKWLFMSHVRKPVEPTLPRAKVADQHAVAVGTSIGCHRAETNSTNNKCGQPPSPVTRPVEVEVPFTRTDAANMAIWDPLAAASETATRDRVQHQQQHGRLMILLSGALARAELNSQILPAMWLACCRTPRVRGRLRNQRQECAIAAAIWTAPSPTPFAVA